MSAGDHLSGHQFSKEHITASMGYDPGYYSGHDGLPYRGAWDFPADHPGPRMSRQKLPFEIQHHAGEDTHSFHAVSPEYYEPEYEDKHRKHYGSLNVEKVGEQHVIYKAEVHEDFQGEGVGSALYAHAKAHLGTVYHDNRLTDAGSEWVKKVGGPRIDQPEVRWQQ